MAQREGIVFLPWLRLEQSIEAEGLQFLPIGVKKGFGDLPPYMIQQCIIIASSYCAHGRNRIPDFTLVIRPGVEKPWNLINEDFLLARELSSLLFLSSWSLNKYFCQIGDYANSSLFRLVGQYFNPEDPSGIALSHRRRDSDYGFLTGGLSHGEALFVAPPHYAINKKTKVDVSLLQALCSARGKNSDLYRQTKNALSLLLLANTDLEFMDETAEVILLASAYETFFGIEDKAKADNLGKEFEATFSKVATLSVEDAINKGRAIPTGTKYLPAKDWSVRRAWAHEFYQMRNNYIHASKDETRTWGWAPLEHLIMGAFALPLALKIKLKDEGLYTLTDEDKSRIRAIPKLLAATDWAQGEHPGAFKNRWKDIMSEWDFSEVS